MPKVGETAAWWHWTGGHVTQEGITKGLEWMKRVGTGSGTAAGGSRYGRGQSVEKPITFLSPEWFDAIRHATSECRRIGLETTLVSSSGGLIVLLPSTS
ncbi:MAG: hypothetical protein KBE04_08155 [Phycisphaerae bacterium]|nr:hypothetical protein [Phycisphaerae bacterium]